MHFLNSEKIFAKLPCKEVVQIYTPRNVYCLEILIYLGNMLTNVDPGIIFLQYLWYWVLALLNCWFYKVNTIWWAWECVLKLFMSFYFFTFLLQICELSDLWPTAFPDTQGLKNKQKIGQLRSPAMAFPFPGLSPAVRLNPLMRVSSPTSQEGPQANLMCQLLQILISIFIYPNPLCPSKPRTLPTRKGLIQILNLWNSPLELHLGALRIFNPDKEKEQVFPEIPCMAL